MRKKKLMFYGVLLLSGIYLCQQQDMQLWFQIKMGLK